MNPPQPNSLDPDSPQLPNIKIHRSASPRHPNLPPSTPTPTAGARRKIGVSIDLSDESAHVVTWVVNHYLRHGDDVVLLHINPTSVLFGADWGPVPISSPRSPEDAAATSTVNNHQKKQQKIEEDFDAFTVSKVADLARPLKEAQVSFKTHIVKDHDMKERLCLEVERLGLSDVIMGSIGFGAAKRGSNGKLGSVSDYCVHHCVCPVVVVRYPDDEEGDAGGNAKSEVVVNVPVDEGDEEEKLERDRE